MGSDQTLEDLVTEAAQHKDRLRTSAEALARVYDTIERRSRRPSQKEGQTDPAIVRRLAVDLEVAPAYVQMAHAGRRLVAVVVQALRRTDAFDRLATSSRRASEEAYDRRVEVEVKAAQTKRKQREEDRREADRRARWGLTPETPSRGLEEDLIDLYGEG